MLVTHLPAGRSNGATGAQEEEPLSVTPVRSALPLLQIMRVRVAGCELPNGGKSKWSSARLPSWSSVAERRVVQVMLASCTRAIALSEAVTGLRWMTLTPATVMVFVAF